MKTLGEQWKALIGVVGLIWTGSLCGCLAVGYTSGGGWFMWPGGLGLALVVLLVLLVLRRR